MFAALITAFVSMPIPVIAPVGQLTLIDTFPQLGWVKSIVIEDASVVEVTRLGFSKSTYIIGKSSGASRMIVEGNRSQSYWVIVPGK